MSKVRGKPSDIEYVSLRSEIRDMLGREVSIVTFGYTAAAVLIGYGLSSQKSTVFLVPVLILALVLIQLNNNIYSFMSIAVYIRVCIEKPRNDLRWETDLSSSREIIRQQKKYASLGNFAATNYGLVTIFMGSVCILLASLFAVAGYESILSVLVMLVWTRFSFVMWHRFQFVNSGKYETDLEKMWGKAAEKTDESRSEQAETRRTKSY